MGVNLDTITQHLQKNSVDNSAKHLEALIKCIVGKLKKVWVIDNFQVRLRSET